MRLSSAAIDVMGKLPARLFLSPLSFFYYLAILRSEEEKALLARSTTTLVKI